MKGILCALALSLAVLLPSSGTQAAQRLSIATGGTSGVYFPIGGAIAKAVSKGGVIQATAETSNASVANINHIAKQEIETGIVQNDITFWAYHGQNMFSKDGKGPGPLKNLRTVLSIYPEHVHLIATKNSGIKSLMDLKGKRVSVGAPGSGVEADARTIFELAGLSYKDMTADRLDFTATAARFKDNQVDAAIMTTGYPQTAIMDIAISKDITLVSLDKAFVDKLCKAFPFFVPHFIPAGTYRGVDSRTETAAVMSIIITHAAVPDDVIYAFLKGIFDNLDEVKESHAKAQEIVMERALNGLTAPLHPGAVKFYKEKGLTIPASLLQ